MTNQQNPHPSAMFGSSRKQFRKRRSCGYRFAGCLLGPVAKSWSGDLKLLAYLSEANVGHAIPFRNLHDGFRPDPLINLFTIVPRLKLSNGPTTIFVGSPFLFRFLFFCPYVEPHQTKLSATGVKCFFIAGVRKRSWANLNWLFSQFIYQTAFPSYEMQYKIEDQPGGKVIISGIVSQKNAPLDWIMVLPVKFSFAEKQFAFGTVLVQGAYSPFQIELPARPKKVELDPDRWILAEGISTKGN